MIAVVRGLVDAGALEEVEGHPELTLFGGGVFDFTSADIWRVASEMLSEREKTILHGRVADFLHDRRIEMRAELDRLESEEIQRSTPDAERQVVRQVKRQELIQAFDRSLAHHLTQSRRPLEAAEFVTRAANRSLEGNPRNAYHETATAYLAVDTTRACEFLLGELVTADPSYDIHDITRAEISLALTNAHARAKTGRFDLAEEYVEQAVDKSRWLGDGLLSVRVLTQRMSILYWTGQSERAREVFEQLMSSHLEDLEPALLDAIVEVFRVWEHPLVAGAKLEEAREQVERLDRRDLEERLAQASFSILNRWRMRQWTQGVVGDEQLANVTVNARVSGLLPVWVEILLEGVESEVYAEWERHAEYHLSPHDLQAVRTYAEGLVRRSERMSDLARRAAQATNVSEIPTLDARSRIAWAKLFGTWRRRARHLLRTWGDLVSSLGPEDAMFEQLDALFNHGRLDESHYVDALETAINLADRYRLTQDSVMLRSDLLQQPTVGQQRANQVSRELRQLTDDVPERALSIFELTAELGRAVALGERTRTGSIAETIESTASRYLSRVTHEDRIWLTAQAANAWQLLEACGPGRVLVRAKYPRYRRVPTPGRHAARTGSRRDLRRPHRTADRHRGPPRVRGPRLREPRRALDARRDRRTSGSASVHPSHRPDGNAAGAHGTPRGLRAAPHPRPREARRQLSPARTALADGRRAHRGTQAIPELVARCLRTGSRAGPPDVRLPPLLGAAARRGVSGPKRRRSAILAAPRRVARPRDRVGGPQRTRRHV